jgi:hypothetical protein
VRAFLAAVVRKKLGLRLESEKTDGERVYTVAMVAPLGPHSSASTHACFEFACRPTRGL